MAAPLHKTLQTRLTSWAAFPPQVSDTPIYDLTVLQPIDGRYMNLEWLPGRMNLFRTAMVRSERCCRRHA